jgi:hypothetical protein
MRRLSHLATPLAALALLAAAPTTPASSGDGPTATASQHCNVGDYRGYGTTYVRWIHTRNVGCRRGRRLVRAFHECRKGPRGRCRRVDGYRCRENRSFSPDGYQFDSTATCRRGGKVVKHGYTQNI